MASVAQDQAHARVEEGELAIAVLERVEVEFGTILNVSDEGRKVTWVPFLPAGASPTTFSGASGVAVAEAHPMLLAVAPDGQLEHLATAR